MQDFVKGGLVIVRALLSTMPTFRLAFLIELAAELIVQLIERRRILIILSRITGTTIFSHEGK